jgi:hypothetical protein
VFAGPPGQQLPAAVGEVQLLRGRHPRAGLRLRAGAHPQEPRGHHLPRPHAPRGPHHHLRRARGLRRRQVAPPSLDCPLDSNPAPLSDSAASAKVSKFAEEAGIDGLNQWPAILGATNSPRNEIVFNLPRSQVKSFCLNLVTLN